MIIFVEAKGIEPLLEEPKSSVLPLDDASMDKSIQGKPKTEKYKYEKYSNANNTNYNMK